MDPMVMAQALVALSGGAQERKVFLNTGEHFVDGKAITTEANEGEEQDACHDTLEWHQNKATSVSMAALIAEFITEAKMAAGSGGIKKSKSTVLGAGKSASLASPSPRQSKRVCAAPGIS